MAKKQAKQSAFNAKPTIKLQILVENSTCNNVLGLEHIRRQLEKGKEILTKDSVSLMNQCQFELRINEVLESMNSLLFVYTS